MKNAMNKITSVFAVFHYGLLILLTACDLLIHLMLYVTVRKFWSLAKLRLKLMFSDLPKDLKQSVYEKYGTYIVRRTSFIEIFRLVSDFRPAPSRSSRGSR